MKSSLQIVEEALKECDGIVVDADYVVPLTLYEGVLTYMKWGRYHYVDIATADIKEVL